MSNARKTCCFNFRQKSRISAFCWPFIRLDQKPLVFSEWLQPWHGRSACSD